MEPRSRIIRTGVAVSVINWLVMTAGVVAFGTLPTLAWFWSAYAAVALAVIAAAATRHGVVAAVLAVPLGLFTIISPFYLGIWMLPSTVAAIVVAVRVAGPA